MARSVQPVDENHLEKTVKLLTFNTWGLKYVSKLRKERLRAIADKLATEQDGDYDIVALQEIWVEEDWKYIEERCKKQFPYRRIFKSGIITGPGLALLSKIPIESTFLYRFPINGRSSAFFRGDWYVGKGIAVTLLKPHTPGSTPIALLNSHMHAPYSHTGDSSYACHRSCQAWDFVKIVKMLKKSGYAVIQVGDLNSKPGSLPYKLFTIEGGLVDSWESIYGANANDEIIEPEEIGTMTFEDQILIGGVTCDSKLNTWRANRQPWEACRLDYALVDSTHISTVNAQVRFTERLEPPYNCSYSDHFAYSAEFLIKASDNSRISKSAFSSSERIDVFKEFLLNLQEYQRYTIPEQTNWRRFHFFAGIITLIIFHFLMPWCAKISPYLALLVLFFSTVLGITAVLNGLIWYFGVRSEARALEEVQMEVEDNLTSLKDE